MTDYSGVVAFDLREYHITERGFVIDEPLRGYRGLTTGIPAPERWADLPDIPPRPTGS